MVTTYVDTTETTAKIETAPIQTPVEALAERPDQPRVPTSSNITAGPDTTVGGGALSVEYFTPIEPSNRPTQRSGTKPSRDIAIGKIVTPEARPYVQGKRHLVQGLEGIILEYVNQSQVKVDEFSIEIKHLIRGKKRKPLLWITAKVDPQVHPNQALALWDAIGTGIDEWRRRLSALDRRLLEEEISVSVDWVEPNASPTR
ncbi:MAG: hypothetical protein HY535_02885 [Chloroflexi bacterium]|nr:hypothetical protein [Chloroflexota bacterium]